MKPADRCLRFVRWPLESALLMETTTAEERLTRIEREFDELKHEVLGLKPLAKGWRQTVGAIPDDELSRNAEKLGREWREQENKD